jgi:hypothetical protein
MTVDLKCRVCGAAVDPLSGSVHACVPPEAVTERIETRSSAVPLALAPPTGPDKRSPQVPWTESEERDNRIYVNALVAVLGVVALIVMLVLVVKDDPESADDVAPPTSVQAPGGSGEPPPTNPFGDVIGEASTSAHPAALFARAMQNGELDPTASPEHTDAYYALVWSNAVRRVDASEAAEATSTGYRLRTADGDPLEVRHLILGADGRVVSYTEVLDGVAAGVPTGLDQMVRSTGVCAPPPGDCAAGFASMPFAADVNGSGYRLFVLARITIDAGTPALIAYIEPPAGVVDAPVTLTPSEPAARIRVEPATNLLVIAFPDELDGDTLGIAVTTSVGAELGFDLEL